MELRQGSKKKKSVSQFVWAHLKGIPTKMMWPVRVEKETSGYMDVFCRADDAIYTIYSTETLPFPAQRWKEIGMKCLKKKLNTITCFLQDFEWANNDGHCYGNLLPISKEGKLLKPFQLTSKCLIGRDKNCDIIINLNGVDPVHCEINEEKSDVLVTNLSDSSPVVVDSAIVSGNKAMHQNSVLQVGSRSFLFQYPALTSAAICDAVPLVTSNNCSDEAEILDSGEIPMECASLCNSEIPDALCDMIFENTALTSGTTSDVIDEAPITNIMDQRHIEESEMLDSGEIPMKCASLCNSEITDALCDMIFENTALKSGTTSDVIDEAPLTNIMDQRHIEESESLDSGEIPLKCASLCNSEITDALCDMIFENTALKSGTTSDVIDEAPLTNIMDQRHIEESEMLESSEHPKGGISSCSDSVMTFCDNSVNENENDEMSEVWPSISGSKLNISVMPTHTLESGQQKWDKKHACKYCEKLFPKLARHMEDMHEVESDVSKALSFPKQSKERRDIWQKIRNDGDWNYNFQVFNEGKGMLIPKYRMSSSKSKPVSMYIPCTFCKGMYSKRCLNDHRKSCSFIAGEKSRGKRNQAVKEGLLLLPIPKGITESFFTDVMSIMDRDDVYSIIQSSPLILKFGRRLYENKHIQEHTANHISCRMRELGRLVIEARKHPTNNIFQFEHCLDPSKFNELILSIKSLAGFTDSTHMYTTPSLALKVGYSLMRCAKILKSDGIIENDDAKQKMASSFLTLYETNWNDMVSARARLSLSDHKYNKPKMLPLSADVWKLNTYLKTETGSLIRELSGDITLYGKLSKLALCHVTLFNRKRGGDVQRMTVETYRQALVAESNIIHDDEVLASLPSNEVVLSKTMTRVEIKGKHERKVAIILTPHMKICINLLIEHREKANITGAYVYCRPSPSERPYRATDVLRETAFIADLKYPHAITYTNLRKHVATMAQVHEIGELGQDQLANFLGHNIRIHREVYRQPLDLIQKTKIVKMLLRVNEGKSIEDMTFDTTEEPELTKPDIDSEEEEEEEDICARTDKDCVSPSTTPPSRKFKKTSAMRTPWASTELDAVKKRFAGFVACCKVPGKRDIEKIQKEELMLAQRSWRNIKYCVYNLIQKKR